MIGTIRRIWEIVKEQLNDIATVANVLDFSLRIIRWIFEAIQNFF